LKNTGHKLGSISTAVPIGLVEERKRGPVCLDQHHGTDFMKDWFLNRVNMSTDGSRVLDIPVFETITEEEGTPYVKKSSENIETGWERGRGSQKRESKNLAKYKDDGERVR